MSMVSGRSRIKLGDATSAPILFVAGANPARIYEYRRVKAGHGAELGEVPPGQTREGPRCAAAGDGLQRWECVSAQNQAIHGLPIAPPISSGKLLYSHVAVPPAASHAKRHDARGWPSGAALMHPQTASHRSGGGSKDQWEHPRERRGASELCPRRRDEAVGQKTARRVTTTAETPGSYRDTDVKRPPWAELLKRGRLVRAYRSSPRGGVLAELRGAYHRRCTYPRAPKAGLRAGRFKSA